MDNDFSEIYRRYFLDYENLDAFLFHAQEELTCISLEGKRVLEIGCGRGAFSLYMALSGKAQKVIALDEAEGHGSDEKGFHQLDEIVQKNSISNVETIKSGINKVKIQENTLDLIVANFSIHHVIRSSGYIFKDKKAKEDLLNIFNYLKRYLKKDGQIVLREMSRINFWRFMPYRWKMSHIDWEIHPTLKEWLWVLKTAGFEDLSYTFLTPYFLSKWPSLLVRNRLANFFFSSTFYLYGNK
jgi:SAM-dependent methyltransferase